MLAVKGRYNGTTVVLDSIPPIKECEVIVNFPDMSIPSWLCRYFLIFRLFQISVFLLYLYS